MVLDTLLHDMMMIVGNSLCIAEASGSTEGAVGNASSGSN